MKTITTTTTRTTTNAKVFNPATKAISIDEISFVGELNERTEKQIKAYYEKYQGIKVLNIYKDDVKTSTTTYAVPEQWFFDNAKAMDKRPNGDFVSRTAKGCKCAVWLYDSYTDNTESVTKFAKGDNLDKAKKEIEKAYKGTDKVVLTVDIIEVIEQLYVMPIEQFIKNAKVVTR